ncbi:MAG: extracellular solute-binding protein [Rhodoluna sp.]|jgi:multiple sugar transport system substrate-binding protein
MTERKAMINKGLKRGTLATAASLAAALVLSGCATGGTTTDSSDSGSSSGGTAADPVTIRVVAAQYTDDMQGYYDDLVSRFEADNADINVEVEVVSWNDIDQKLKTMVQTGDLPDIGNLNYFSSFAADGLLYSADELVPADVLADMVPTFIENSKYEGTAFAVPDLASARLFFYNKDILAQAGVSVDELATWDGLEAALKKIKAAVPDVVPLALPLGPEEAQAEFMIWANSNDGGVYANGEWTITDPKNVETMEFLSGLVADGLTNPAPATFNRTDGAFALFAQGKAAMLNGAIFLPSVLADQGSTVNYGFTNFPTNRADGKSITLGVQDYFFGFKKDGNKDAVQRFMSFLFEPDNYSAFLEAAGGFLPATVSAGEAMSSDEALAPYIAVLPNAVFYPGSEASWPAVQGEMQQTIGLAVAPGADILSVLENIASKAE